MGHNHVTHPGVYSQGSINSLHKTINICPSIYWQLPSCSFLGYLFGVVAATNLLSSTLLIFTTLSTALVLSTGLPLWSTKLGLSSPTVMPLLSLSKFISHLSMSEIPWVVPWPPGTASSSLTFVDQLQEQPLSHAIPCWSNIGQQGHPWWTTSLTEWWHRS